jgi:hypothetical protein
MAIFAQSEGLARIFDAEWASRLPSETRKIKEPPRVKKEEYVLVTKLCRSEIMAALEDEDLSEADREAFCTYICKIIAQDRFGVFR